MDRTRVATTVLGITLALGGCASGPLPLTIGASDPSHFGHWRCDEMHDEIDRVQQRATDVAYGTDLGRPLPLALGHGVSVFWPALRAMRREGPEAVELERLERRHALLREAVKQRGCLPPALATADELAGMLPLAPGDRLVYEERTDPRRPAEELRLTLDVVRRGRLEFSADLAGRPLRSPWVQDAAGNLVAVPAGLSLVHWTRLLPREASTGDVVAGELLHPGGHVARVRGQVIALGVHTALGRPFDTAVIELFGDVTGRAGGARVDGMMVVDRRSGVLLRLELNSADPDFALRRTLLRVQPGR